MKSPKQLRKKLIKQWLSADNRQQRFSNDFNWPLKIPIGKPTASIFKNSPAIVREHIQQWRKENQSTVEWQAIKYQAASQAVEIPTYWRMNSLDELIDICKNNKITTEYNKLTTILNQTKDIFHSLLIRQRSLWLDASANTVINCCELSLQLTPGIADGKPLRALSLCNIDSKFIENNRQLIIKLLNIIYDNVLHEISLEEFLGAALSGEHWLLVIPLDKSLLPFQQLRLRSSELKRLQLPGSHLLIIENEQCKHQLPELKNTLAILGAGLDLNWLDNPNFKNKNLAYWGDIDSWGLKILATAKEIQPKIIPLLMKKNIFIKYRNKAVAEPQIASNQSPAHLSSDEKVLYQTLIKLEKGRLEQEFIERSDIEISLRKWHKQ